MRMRVFAQWFASPQGCDEVCKGGVQCLQRGSTGADVLRMDRAMCLRPVWRLRQHHSFAEASLRIFSFVGYQRKVGLRGSYSPPAQTWSAIVAASAFSCAKLHTLFMLLCDCWLVARPRLRITTHVDCLAISCCGRSNHVEQDFEKATFTLIGSLESGHDFHVSKTELGQQGPSVVLEHATRTLGPQTGVRAVSLCAGASGADAPRRHETHLENERARETDAIASLPCSFPPRSHLPFVSCIRDH